MKNNTEQNKYVTLSKGDSDKFKSHYFGCQQWHETKILSCLTCLWKRTAANIPARNWKSRLKSRRYSLIECTVFTIYALFYLSFSLNRLSRNVERIFLFNNSSYIENDRMVMGRFSLSITYTWTAMRIVYWIYADCMLRRTFLLPIFTIFPSTVSLSLLSVSSHTPEQ